MTDEPDAIRILLLEDNPGDVRLVEEALREAGPHRFALTSGGTLEDGLRLIERHGFDIVLLDLQLPDSSHLETFRRVRAAAPALPIVVMTIIDDEEFALSAVAEGAQDYLIKGRIDADLLPRVLGYALERHRMVRRMHDMNESMRDFISHASHELRTPVAVISGLTSTISRAEELAPTDAQQVLEALERQVGLAKLLIDELLDLSQLESASVRLDMEPVDVADLLDQLLDSAPFEEGRVHVDVERGAKITTDRLRLSQMLNNLVSNAYKYGGVRIDLGYARRDGVGIFTVRDDGPGVPKEIEGRMFEPFVRGPDEARAGSGLGLVIVRKVAALLGATVAYENDGGALFTVTLPDAG